MVRPRGGQWAEGYSGSRLSAACSQAVNWLSDVTMSNPGVLHCLDSASRLSATLSAISLCSVCCIICDNVCTWPVFCLL